MSQPLIDAYNGCMVRQSGATLEIDGVGLCQPVQPASVICIVRWQLGPRRRALIARALRQVADLIEEQRATASPGARHI